MPAWPSREQQYWCDRIARRIHQHLQRLRAADPPAMERIRQAAYQQALQSLGLAEIQAELDHIDQQRQELDRRSRQARRAQWAVLRRVPFREGEAGAFPDPDREVRLAIRRRQSLHEEELLAGHEHGRQILAWRREASHLRDTVWLATAPAEIKALWRQLVFLLGEPLPPLQEAALAMPMAPAE